MADTPGMELVADFRGGEVRILRAMPLKHAPRLWLREPCQPSQLADVRRQGRPEVVLEGLNAEGKAIESFAFAPRGTRYADWMNPKTGKLTGAPRHVRPDEVDIRTLRVPLPPEAGWLLFRAQRAKGLRRIDHRSLALCALERGQASMVPRLPLSLGVPRTVVALERPGLLKNALHLRHVIAQPGQRLEYPQQPPSAPQFPSIASDYCSDAGRIVSVETLVNHGASQSKFDIVIMGDGFQERELKKFDRLAGSIVNGLQKMEPFKSVRDFINWHVVRVASKDSGVDNCPTRRPKATFFQMEGCWDDTDVRAFIGVDEFGLNLIAWAAEKVAPWEYVNLVIVIANCKYYGGHAWPGAKLVLVSASSESSEWFVPLVAHEAAHVISHLADEYTGCGEEDPDRPDPNKARLPEVAASVRRRLIERAPSLRGSSVCPQPALQDSVWWKHLARRNESNKDGTFSAVHVLGDARKSKYRPRLVPASREKKLGVFWGCQDTETIDSLLRAYCQLLELPDSPAPTSRDQLWRQLGLPTGGRLKDWEVDWWDPTSGPYFRPMAVCRMRQVTFEFCRVCQHLLKNSIKDVCGEPLDSPFPSRI
jgi:hypothetical protein